MKIVHFILGKANPNRMNGVNSVVNNLAAVQIEIGYDVSVWGVTFDLEHNYPKRNFKTRLFLDSSNKFKLDARIERELEKLDKNVVFHIHGGFIPQFYSLSKLLVKYNIKYILTSHGSYNTEALKKNKWVKKIYFYLIEKYVIKNAKAVHFIGESEYENIDNLSSFNKKKLIPNGQNILNLNFIKLNKSRSLNLVFCGRIDIKTKGLDILFKGFSDFIYKREGRGRITIIGSGSELVELKKLAKDLKILKFVNFAGKQFGTKKYQLLSQADVFCLTSRNEGMPMSVLEAAGLGIPCLVSKETNMAGYIDKYNAGRTLSENTPEDVSVKLQSLSILKHNGEFKRMKENCFKMIQQEFDWNYIAKELIALYAA